MACRSSTIRVKVKLLVDADTNRVLFAESGKDFVDVLFSFLTMPLASVIRILGKKLSSSPSSLGSLSNIYDSVVNLDRKYFQTEACKTMLLHPRSAAEAKCEQLAVNIDDTIEPRAFYTCQHCTGLERNFYYSSVVNTPCSCGSLMSAVNKLGRETKTDNGDGVFVKGPLTYIVSDDLNVSQASAAVLMSRFKCREIEDVSKLEERSLDLGSVEIESLLWRALVSKTPLTDLYFNKTDEVESEIVSERNRKNMIQPKCEVDAESTNPNEVKLKLIVSKMNNEILYAEVEDMANVLFSFLTFPLGLLFKHSKSLGKGCIANLYKSVECSNFIRSEECKSMLVSPKLPAFLGCTNQLLKAEETVSQIREVPGCYTYISRRQGSRLAEFREVNPKSHSNETARGGQYVKTSNKFMMTDDLHIIPMSLISSVQLMNEFKVLPGGLDEREVSMGLSQALDLLRAAFISRTALTDVFAPKKKWRRMPSQV